ncbi:MAG TPA: NAD-dependent epimerase/dehydratase family protein [Candidatus Eisenbacteria bacterium]|uniref:NAD-dependent epimerase/dehydratase family protein n=1 Tax=Eiseniibacteriota bacterium TaxID=2212470 RepID=A0A7V2F3F6_UNCEI|nr:NAD-dependent epimerase/dehydratase family protein [Candidatus Eisenbacteria bacterium]
MRRRIFITGAAGKAGSALLDLVFERGGGVEADVACLCRSDACRERLSRFPVAIAEGDASDAVSLRRAYRGEETVVHLSSIFHAPAVVEACREAKRLVVLSSTGVFSRFRRSAAEIGRCEKLIESSGIPYTILRPTMIYGTPDDRNISRLVRLVARSPVVPLPGGGRARFQPVHVRDLAACIAACLESGAGIGRSYNVPGGSAHGLGEIIRIIAGLLGKRVLLVPVPLGPVLLAARALRLRVDPEQIERLREDKTFPYDDAAVDLGYAPMVFEDGLRLQLEAMGLMPVST